MAFPLAEKALSHIDDIIGLNCCFSGSLPWKDEDIKDVILYLEGQPDGESHHILLMLKDGKVGHWSDWEDYTGHG